MCRIFASDQCLIEIDPKALSIWASFCLSWLWISTSCSRSLSRNTRKWIHIFFFFLFCMMVQESSQISFIDANFHIPINLCTADTGYWYMILITNASSPLSRWIHGATITSLLRQNDVATSFCRNNDVIITPCAHWVCDVYSGQTIMFHWKYSISPLHSCYFLPLILRWHICVLSETSYTLIVKSKQKKPARVTN